MNIWMIGIIEAFAITFLTVPLAIHFAKKYGVVTDARSKSHPAHTHQGIIPRWGGAPIILGITIAALPLVINNTLLRFVLLGAVFTTIVGLIDDKYDLSPYLRLALNGAAATLAVVGGLGIPFITSPFDSIVQLSVFQINIAFFGHPLNILWLSDILAVVWIMWCMNMVNWSKGVDGQLPGFTAIAALLLGVLALRFTRHEVAATSVALLAFIVAGAFGGFLPWNFYPQRILAGYGAGSLAGYMLGVLSILAWGKLGMMLLVLALPITDACIVMLRRIAQKRSPFRGDNSHFHHSLLALGWGRRRIAIFYWVVTALLGIFALQVGPSEKFFGFLLITLIIIGIISWSYYFAHNGDSTKIEV